MLLKEICALCLVVTAVSFLGFLVENIWLSVTKGYMDNRNMCMPFLLGYGLAIVAIYKMFGTPLVLCFFGLRLSIKNRIAKALLFFGLVCLCVAVGEIVLGTVMERMCGIIWWDYTSLPLHVTRYTSVPTSMAFGCLITVFMRFFFEPLKALFLAMDFPILVLTAGGFAILLAGDYVYSMCRMYRQRRLIQFWRIDTSHTRIHKLWLSRHPAS